METAQKLVSSIESRIDAHLENEELFGDGERMHPLDLAASDFEQWLNKPHITLLDTLAAQTPVRMLVSSRGSWEEKVMRRAGPFFRVREVLNQVIQHPGYRSIQLHVRIKGCPDYITFVYTLSLIENKESKLSAYLNRPLESAQRLKTLGEVPFMMIKRREWIASLDNLETFTRFLDQAQEVTNEQAWISQ